MCPACQWGRLLPPAGRGYSRYMGSVGRKDRTGRWAGRGAAALFLLLAAGCAPASRTLVSAGGDVRACPPREESACIAGARAAGYVEQEQIGVVGITVAESAEPGKGLRILKVVPGSPAAASGVAAGDYLVRIKGQPVRGRREARMLMFGRAGTKVEFTVRRGIRVETVKVERVPAGKMGGQGR